MPHPPEHGRPRRDATYWRALADAYADGPGAGAGEFPPGADLAPDLLSRRGFIGLLGASMALAGLGGCGGGAAGGGELVPFALQPLGVVPGRPARYATTMTLDGFGTGLIAESHEGRPTKLEGNPDHPASLGASGVLEQASLLQLYDPDRARAARHHDQPCLWQDGLVALAATLDRGGGGLRVLIPPTASPTLIALLEALRGRWPATRIHVHDPAGHGDQGHAAAAARALFGAPLRARYRLDAARVILCLDADPLASGPWHLRHARGFAANRGHRAPGQGMNRLYVAESSPTCTGSAADHRLRLRDGDICALALAVLGELVDAHGLGPPHPALNPLLARRMPATPWIRAVAGDLAAARGAGLVIAGPRQPPLVHAVAHAIAVVIGAHGATSGFAPSPLHPAEGDLAGLAAALDGGAVDGLLILGSNPLATAPGDLPIRAALAKARCLVHLGMYEDETAQRCEWFIPQAHELECWGDAGAHDGTLSLQQPLIAPLHGGRSPLEALAALLGDQRPGRELVRAAWRGRWRDLDEAAFAGRFAESLRRGAAAGTASAELAPEADWSAIPALAAASPAADAGRWEVSLRLDAKVHDGRFANNPWLQELPDPVTKLTWDNAALLSPASARALGAADGDLLELRCGESRIEIPALVLPGQADGAIAVALGYGRSGAERTAAGVGSDAYALRRADRPWTLPDAQVRRLDGRRELAQTQRHWSLEDRPIVLERTRAEFARQPVRAGAGRAQPSLRGAAASEGRQWGMVVDLSACMGCSACVIACQAENNIPVVGRENVRRSREMHWLRVDRYYRGDPDDPVAVSQPMACQHCEKAPCEYVCPTYATTHSRDGLNEMTYNRCVGTRFCSNNCPYKVRRFNWYEFSSASEPLLALARNPEVTVRARGVMEKCTYCVQRIRTTEIAATVAGRELRTDEVVTACQQACPAQAIVFGDIADPRSAVAGLRASPLAYGVLDETGAQPRTRYLERLSNPNPDLA